jgi:formylglycine-generating enzyme required for sulfatase activity
MATRPDPGSPFGTPSNVPGISSSVDDGAPSVTSDGLHMFLQSGTGSDYDVFASDRATVGSAFTGRTAVSVVNTPNVDYGPQISPDGLTLVFASNRNRPGGDTDLWITTRASVSSTFEPPVEISELNTTTYYEFDPVLSADGLTLYFGSDRPGGLGSYDIWVATRATPLSPFGSPTDVTEVNSSASDSPTHISADGTALYLSSFRSGGAGDMDMWVATRTCAASCPAGMALVPAGPFVMGSDPGEGSPSERPEHIVTLSPYCIDRTEVTNEAYGACVTAGRCLPPTDLDSWTRTNCFMDPTYADYPVTWIDWARAASYCAWTGGRLPTEAEWEKAARGGCELVAPAMCGAEDERTYPWGDAVPTCSIANAHLGASDAFCVGDTWEVGSRAGGDSPYGLHDMTGNLWEWTSDWFGATAYDACAAGCSDPAGPTSGLGHTRRGGSWFDRITDGEGWLRTSARYGDAHVDSVDAIFGFRCAADPCTRVFYDDFEDGDISDWNVESLYYHDPVNSRIPVVVGGVYQPAATGGYQGGGHHRLLDRAIEGTTFDIRARVRGSTSMGNQTTVALHPDTTRVPCSGGFCSFGYRCTWYPARNVAEVVRMDGASNEYMARATVANDDAWHELACVHLSSGAWRIVVDGASLPLTLNVADVTYGDFRYVSTFLDPGAGVGLDDIEVRECGD